MKKRIYIVSLLLLSLPLFVSSTYAQLNNTRYTSNGSKPLDITMISSMVLQPAWLTISSTTTNVTVVRPVTTKEQFATGRNLSLNNQVANSRGIQVDGTNNNGRSTFALAPPESKNASQYSVGMVYADCDDDPTTFQSSSALLDFGAEMGCTEVEAAFLYWTGYSASTVTYAPYNTFHATYEELAATFRSYPGGAIANDISSARNVLFKPAGDSSEPYIPITGTLVTGSEPNYTYVADVTQHVKGRTGGIYWVANVRSGASDTNASSGWSLVVIFRPPNCPPRSILLVDGYAGSSSGSPGSVTLTLSEQPATDNSVSYLGFIGRDSEDFAAYLGCPGDSDGPQNTVIQVRSNNGTNQRIQQFEDQPRLFNVFTHSSPSGTSVGTPHCQASGTYDGAISSTLTAYNKENGLNGNQIEREPETRYTLGYDAHHIRMPDGAVRQDATQVIFTFPSEQNGGWSTSMAYLAIETLQADLKLDMESSVNSVQTGSTIYYTLTVKNVGGAASSTGSYITNILPKTVNFVPSSLIFLDKNKNPIAPSADYSHSITGQGTDSETLTINIGALAAGLLGKAQDSVQIKFDAQVVGLERTDIWNYGCNRDISSRATLTYITPTGTVEAGSNAGRGCDGLGMYDVVMVDDVVLEEQYVATHFADDDISEKVNQGSLNIVTTIKEYLKNLLIAAGLPSSQTEIDKYVVYNAAGVAVSASAIFVQTDEAIQQFMATADLGDGCLETFTFDLTVSKSPKAEVTIDKAPTCPETPDGKVLIAVSDGEPGYGLMITSEDGQEVKYRVYSPDANATYTFSVDGLIAGNYKFEVSDKGSFPMSGSFTVPSATPMSVSLGNSAQTICKGETLTLQATATPASGLSFVWKKSIDGKQTWEKLSGESASTLNLGQLSEGADYRVYACNNLCQVTSEVRVNVNPLPVVVLKDTTVSITIEPTATFAATVTDITLPMTKATWQASTNGGTTWLTIPNGGLLGTHSISTDLLSLEVSNISAQGLAMDGYKYKLLVEDNNGCKSNDDADAIATLTVVEGPAVTSTSTPTTCANTADGALQFSFAAGEPGQDYDVNLYTGSGYSDQNLPSTPSLGHLVFTGGSFEALAVAPLTSGDYSLVLKPMGGMPGLKTYYHVYTVQSPPLIEVSISAPDAACIGSEVTLKANVSGGHSNGVKTCQWYQSEDGGSSYGKQLPGEIYPELKMPGISTDLFLMIEVKDNDLCPTEALHYVEALITPEIVSLLPNPAIPDTACYYYDLAKLPVMEVAGVPEYDVTWHYNKPLNATDNRYLIRTVDHVVSRGQKTPFEFGEEGIIWTRMSVKGLCYDIIPVVIFAADIEICSPIIVPPFFSPDGDITNDRLYIGGLEEYSEPQISIFNRYGKLVFEGKRQDFEHPYGWDGTYLGKPLPSDEYWYVIRVKETKNKVGHFSLKRRR